MRFGGSFGDWLKERRKALDLTQQDLADQVHCAVATIRKIEQGERRASKPIAERLVDVLVIAPDDRAAFIRFARGNPDPLSVLGADSDSRLPVHNLPPQLTTFIGRTSELAEIAMYLADSDCRLLTLVGPGGIGKTRLALQSGQQQRDCFKDGTYFVSLASVNTADLLVFAIGGILGISFRAPDTPSVQLLSYLREKDLLLILDNFEHLLDGLPLLLDLLTGAPRLKLMVTSRQRLNVLGEWVFPVEGLAVPSDESDEQVEQASAVQLFVQSAQRVQIGFSFSHQKADVLRICRLLEGMPLGIELAAAWVRLLPCSRIAAQLASNLDFLASPLRNVPERHRSLRAVFDHSWRMLSSTEQAVMARLSVFRGGFDPEAVAQVAGADLQVLASLADKSLIQTDDTGRGTTHELLRQFAADKLSEAGQTEAAARQHFRYFLELAERVDADLYGPTQIAWFDRLETDHDNWRAALAWSLSSGEVENGLALATALGWYWQLRHHEREGYDWSMRLLAVNRSAPPSFWIKALHRAAQLAVFADTEQCRVLGEETLQLARAANDKWNIAWSLATLAYLMNPIDQIAADEEALGLFREIGDEWGISHMLRRLSFYFSYSGDYERALTYAEEARDRARRAGDKSALAWSLFGLGDAYSGVSDFARAEAHFQESFPLFDEIRDHDGAASAQLLMGKIALDQGNNGPAQTYYRATLILRRSGQALGRHI